MSAPFALLCVGGPAPDLAVSPYGPFARHDCGGLDEAAQALREQAYDALLVQLAQPGEWAVLASWPALSHAVLDAAVVVVAPDVAPAMAEQLVAAGVQDVLPAGADVGRALRLAVQRKRIERLARKAYATDLATGLPNHAQLLEHMTHLLALREREPAPMGLLVLRVEGLVTTATALGVEAANVLRRKAAVRLRAALRASDVVAAIGADAFAVLLPWIEAAGDAMHVAAKLAQSLQQPFDIAGQRATLAVSAGVSQYPEHGRDANELLRRAIGQATATAAVGRAGFANRIERGPAAAANDEA